MRGAVRLARACAGVLAAALVVSGCGAVRASRWGSLPAEFRTRVEVPACEELRVPQGVEVDDAAIDACRQQGWDSGDGSEIEVTFPTAEGDPIVQHFRTLPGTEVGVEVFRDSTSDSFGAQRWYFQDCPRATSSDLREDLCEPEEQLG